MNKILFLMVISIPLFSASGDTDIIQRVFNFVIFAYIIYYLVYDKAVDFLKERSQNIELTLKESENKLKNLQEEEKKSKSRIKKAEEKAVEIVEDSKNTVKLIQTKIKKDTANRIEDLNKSYSNKVEVANKKASFQAVEEVLSRDIFSKSIDSLSQDIIVDLINKKVA